MGNASTLAKFHTCCQLGNDLEEKSIAQATVWAMIWRIAQMQSDVRLSPPAYRFRYFYRTEASHRLPVSVKKIAEAHCMTLFFPLLPSLTVNLPEAVGRKLVPVGGFFGTGFGKKATWHRTCAWKSKFQHSPANAHMQINSPDFFLPSSPGTVWECFSGTGILQKYRNRNRYAGGDSLNYA